MKKTSMLLCVLFLFTSFVISADEQDYNKGFNFGVTAGGFPFSSGDSGLIFSLDIGYGLTERLIFRADLSRAKYTKSFLSEVAQESSFQGEYDQSVLPVCVSILYNTSVSEILSASIGIGMGFYSITLMEDITASSSFTGTTTRSNTYKLGAFAPHFLVGIETFLSTQMALVGEVRHILIKTKLEREESDFYAKDDFLMGGLSLKVGIRFYI